MKANLNKTNAIFEALRLEVYSVDEHGVVWSHKSKKPRQLMPSTTKDGYKILSLVIGGSSFMVYVHRIVAMARLPTPDTEKIAVNHIDGDKANNAPGNLEWVTSQENTIHCLKLELRAPWGSKRIAEKIVSHH